MSYLPQKQCHPREVGDILAGVICSICHCLISLSTAGPNSSQARCTFFVTAAACIGAFLRATPVCVSFLFWEVPVGGPDGHMDCTAMDGAVWYRRRLSGPRYRPHDTGLRSTDTCCRRPGTRPSVRVRQCWAVGPDLRRSMKTPVFRG